MNESDSPFKPYERIGTTGGVPGSVGPKRRGRWDLGIFIGAFVVLMLCGLWWLGGDDPESAGAADGNVVQAAHSEGAPGQGSSLVLDAPKAPDGRDDREKATPNSGGLPNAAAPSPDIGSQPKAPKRKPSALESPVEGIIAKWMGVAKEVSKGKIKGSNTVVAVHVRRVSGEVLVDRNTKRSLRPASNLKLLTCMAAVLLCADEGFFETRFDRIGPIEAGVLKGDLVARAGGDPMFDGDGDGGVERWAASLAAQLKQAGIQRIEGALVLDEGAYLEPGPGPMWPPTNEYWTDDCALSGGFSVNAGCLTAHIKPGKIGGSAKVEVRPKGHGLVRKGKVKTVAKKKKLIIAVEAKTSGLMVRGSIPADVTHYDPSFSHPDPVELFGHAMLQGLKDQGIAIGGGLKRQRNVPGGESVALLRTPLTDAFLPILRDSNNSVADQLFFALGHRLTGRGDRESGAVAIATVLNLMEIDSGDMKVVDGSGLSKANAVRADQFTGVLAGLLQRGGPAVKIFMDSLPVAGETGTLRRRMRKGPAAGRVHAKTGFVNGTSALSGVVKTKAGEQLVFSILVAYPHRDGMNTKVFKPMQDEICELLAEFEAQAQ
ncbi:MAG: D-alanyl-D-alanine carboxypeptidase/D-alanyl-D-alanine-endopeptidase (penicillin-binding protein 4) [Glaciecola sp.]|jgi:D-alanyl-D-alanine carboxypeptidase/D-alanyl-D-alanine-endopeptidase (penicillin-binding protein 4)